ncbi:MAG: ribosome silencing factor [Phycisphaerae bacterium]
MAANTRAEEIVLLDLRGRSPVTEFFVIATGTSPRQMRTVAEEIQDLGKRMGFKAWQTSGMESAKWILVDCVSVVTHVFDGESRDFYDLELLWGDCPRIDWRKELGLPAEPEGAERLRSRARFGQSAGADEMEAEEEDARLDGRDLDEEEGDADVDEDAEVDAPIVMELPDESTGSNSVEFVEIDPPTKRRNRGRAVYPTPVKGEDEEEDLGGRAVSLGGADESLDEDEGERESEARADRDVEGVSDEDLPESRLVSRPMGGVSAGLSSTTIEDDDEDQQRGNTDREDVTQDHRDEIPEMHEAAAETTSFAKPVDDEQGVDVSAESQSERPGRGRVLRNRKGERAPTQSAPSGRAGRAMKAGAARKAAPKKAAAAKKAAAKPAKKAPAKKTATKKPAARSAGAGKSKASAKTKASAKAGASAKGKAKKPTKKSKK